MAKFVPQPELSLNDQMQIRREKLAALQAEGRDPFVQTKFDFNADSAAIKADYEAFEGKTVKVAGRLMSKRGQGKVMFCDLQDRAGRIQIFVKIDELGEEEYNRFKKYDIGDIVGVEGEVFKTKTEEISIRAKVVTLLSKSLLPLPNKFHGLTDKEARFRQRYVDLMVNPEVKRNFVIRSKFIKHLRNYLDSMGYIEVETPVLNTIAGGAAARPFVTHHNTLDIDMYMRIATELPLKRLIVGGMDRVYEVGLHEEPSPNSVSSPVSTAKDSRCYTVEDLMEMLLLSRPTVYRLLKQNEFRWFKVSGAYRISKASFEAWLNDGTVERNPAV